MIMDNTPWHKKAKRFINDQVVFVYLPPYSPDINPIEQVWRVTRREAKYNRFFADIKEVEKALDLYYEIYA